MDQNVIKRFGDPLRHRFLFHSCIEQDSGEISDYFRNEHNAKNPIGNDCEFHFNSLLRCRKKNTTTVQCSQFFTGRGNRCQNMIHYDCFLGFLSLLNHECQILFTSQPFCPWCIISYIAAMNKNVKIYTCTPDNYTNYTSYTNLFLHDYKVPSDINPFDSSLNVDPIPRGVVEHYNLHICDPKRVKRGKAQNQAFAETPVSVIAQEKLLRKLRSKDKNEMLNGQNKLVPRFLYFKDHGHVSKKGNWEINRPTMVRAAGHDDKQKGRESKFFRYSVLDKIIGPGTHLEMDLTPQDLFELIRSIRGEHLPGRDSWDKFVRKFTRKYIRHTNDGGSYTTVNCFK